MNTNNGNGHNGVVTASTLQIENWILLNEIRDSRVVYSTGRGMYFITRSSRWVDGRLITTLLEQRYLQEAGETPGVYTVSEDGRQAWAEYTEKLRSLVGRCDTCGQTRNVSPIALAQAQARAHSASWWNLLCAECRKVVFAYDELMPVLALEAA